MKAGRATWRGMRVGAFGELGFGDAVLLGRAGGGVVGRTRERALGHAGAEGNGTRGQNGLAWAGKEEEVGCWVGLGFWFSFLFSFSKHTQTNFEFKSNLNSNPMHSIKYNLCTSMNAQTCYLKKFYFLVKIN